MRSFESGGQFFYGLYAYSMTGLLTASVLFIAYMGIKLGELQTPCLAPLPFIILYCWRHTEKEFKVLSMNMPFDTAVHVDADRDKPEQHDNIHKIISTFSAEFLKQPNVVGAAKIYPYPHRILDIPLLDRHGTLNEVYLDEIPEGMDPSEYVEALKKTKDSHYKAPINEYAYIPTSRVSGISDNTNRNSLGGGAATSPLHSSRNSGIGNNINAAGGGGSGNGRAMQNIASTPHGVRTSNSYNSSSNNDTENGNDNEDNTMGSIQESHHVAKSSKFWRRLGY